jgi:sec-independent protein translocase protein TatB
MRLHPANADYPEPGQADAMPPLADPDAPEDELPPEQRPLP